MPEQVELQEIKKKQHPAGYNSSECFDVSQQPMGLPRKNIETNSGKDPENNTLLFLGHSIRK